MSRKRVVWSNCSMGFAITANPKHQLSGWKKYVHKHHGLTCPSNWLLTDRTQAWVSVNGEPEMPPTYLHNFQPSYGFPFSNPHWYYEKNNLKLAKSILNPCFFHQSKILNTKLPSSIHHPFFAATSLTCKKKYVENLWGHHHWHLWISSRSSVRSACPAHVSTRISFL